MLSPEDLAKLKQLQELSPEDFAKLQIDDKGKGGREKTRLTKSTGQSIKDGVGRIGGPFTVVENPAFLAERLQTYEALAAKRKAELDGACVPAAAACGGCVRIGCGHGWVAFFVGLQIGRPPRLSPLPSLNQPINQSIDSQAQGGHHHHAARWLREGGHGVGHHPL